MGKAKRVRTGSIERYRGDYPTKEGVLTDVRFEDGSLHTVVVADPKKMKGRPAVGSKIRIEHFGPEGVYNFQGFHSLYLESVEIGGVDE